MFDVATGKPDSTRAVHRGGVRRISVSLDGKRIISTGDDLTGLVWDATRLLPSK
jgi:WD40 repeat protein